MKVWLNDKTVDEYSKFENEYQDYRRKVDFEKNYNYLNSHKAITGGHKSQSNKGLRALPETYKSRRW